MNDFAEWNTFYLIVGSAAGALIGLQFVVLTLIADNPQMLSWEAGAAFATPTIVYFSTVLLLAALVSIPWHTVTIPTALWVLMGLGGIGYIGIVTRHVRKQTVYQPGLEDTIFHVLLPLAGYILLVLSALFAPGHPHPALFGVGAASLLLLFVGIHNAWDNVAYHVFVSRQETNARLNRNETLERFSDDEDRDHSNQKESE